MPWQNLAAQGVETRFAATQDGRPSLDDLAAACDRRTRLLAVSWVDFATGWRHDVAELAQLAHDRGALLFLDAIQGLGVFPLDVRETGVDFLAADGHKWLLGPEGAGLFYLRREHLDLLRPLGLGWNSVEQASDFSRADASLKQSASRYEGGTYPMPGFVGLCESLNLILEYGVANLSQRILEVTDEACQGLERLGARIVSDRSEARRSGVVAFDPPRGNPAEVRQSLLAKQIVLSHRGGRLRISPHAYTNEDDLRRLFDALAS